MILQDSLEYEMCEVVSVIKFFYVLSAMILISDLVFMVIVTGNLRHEIFVA